MQKQRAFAFAGTGNSQQIVTQHLTWESHWQRMPCMTRTADAPAIAGG